MRTRTSTPPKVAFADPAAGQARAADHAGGDRVELERDPDAGLGDADPAGQDHPARPAQKPLMRVGERCTCRRTLMPASRTVSALPPMAMIERPAGVRARNTPPITKTASMMTVVRGIGPTMAEPSVRNAGSAGGDRHLRIDESQPADGGQRREGDHERRERRTGPRGRR